MLDIKQKAMVKVVRAKESKLKEPVTCNYCNNKRYWLIRCEHCGRTEQKIS